MSNISKRYAVELVLIQAEGLHALAKSAEADMAPVSLGVPVGLVVPIAVPSYLVWLLPS